MMGGDMPDSDRVTYRAKRNQVPADGRHHSDSINKSREGVRGPFPVLLNSPELAGRIGHLGAYIRYGSGLPDANRELAIITTARTFDCPYEWTAHAPIARDAGVTKETIEAIADEADPDALDEPAATIISYNRELLRDHAVADETYESARDRYGESGIVELTGIIGYYAMIACVLNAF